MLEIQVILSLLNKDTYNKYRNYIDIKTIDKQIKPVINVLDSFYKESKDSLTLDELEILFFTVHKNDSEFYKQVFTNLRVTKPLDSVGELLESYRRQRLLEDMSVAAYEASKGQRPFQDVVKLTEQLGEKSVVLEPEFVSDDLEELLNASVKTPGLKWRLNILNRILGSIRQGDFGFIFARPEAGKTTFLTSEVTYMAEQVDRPILWFNNEEQGGKVKIRCFQASLGITLEELMKDPKKCQEEYLRLTKGNIKIYDDATTDRRQVERLTEQFKPALIVFDQLDKIYGFENDREDLRMGQIYVWARELAKEYAPVIGVCQASGEGDGQEFLKMGSVSNSKTSKAAEADWILGIGYKDEPGYEFIRGIATLKNKLLGDSETDPALRHGKTEVIIKPRIQRFIDVS